MVAIRRAEEIGPGAGTAAHDAGALHMTVCISRSIWILAVCTQAIAQEPDYGRERAAAAELEEMCRADAGRLWGVSLCGPFIVVDLKTRGAWANQADPGGVLRPAGDGWIGVLPADAPVANTAVDWSGVRWTMVISLPESEIERRVLLAHEAWHRIQPQLGLVTSNTDNAHLEDERGRYLLRLELRALRAALEARGNARWRAADEALQFRAERLRHYSTAAAEEAALDRNEGLAAYNGVKLGAAGDAHAYAARTLERHDSNEAYSRSYAYGSGPAYGLLLDERRVDWRASIGADAPADILARALRFRSSADALARAERRHDPDGQVAVAEAKRGEAQRALIAKLRERYGTGARRLVLAIDGRMMSFDPRRVTPVAGLGRVFGVFNARGPWGSLQATDGALVNADFSQATLASPAADGLSGPGWTLTLAPGYRISEPDESGALRLVAPGSP
jgi:hypothetical protein